MTSDYDRWLTTDHVGEAQQAAWEALDEAWALFAQDHDVDYEACEEPHTDHAIYVAWYHLTCLVEARRNALEAAAEAALYEDEAEALEALDRSEGEG